MKILMRPGRGKSSQPVAFGAYALTTTQSRHTPSHTKNMWLMVLIHTRAFSFDGFGQDLKLLLLTKFGLQVHPLTEIVYLRLCLEATQL